MTIEDLLAREAISARLAECAQAGDSLRAEDYAACFTDNGVLQTGGTGDSGLDLNGRAAIYAWQLGLREPGKGLGQSGAVPLTFVRHNLTTCKIELTGPDSAKARTYWMVNTNIGPDHCGVYRDEFHKVEGLWLIARRQVKTEWAVENSLMVPNSTPTASVHERNR